MSWVRDYCNERNNGITADEFINFYDSKGWLIGKSKMKDWQATIRTWEKNRNVVVKEVKNIKDIPPEEPKSRFDPINGRRKRNIILVRVLFLIDEDGESVDYGELTEEERIYLQKKE